jgi:hypothetical protein
MNANARLGWVSSVSKLAAPPWSVGASGSGATLWRAKPISSAAAGGPSPHRRSGSSPVA